MRTLAVAAERVPPGDHRPHVGVPLVLVDDEVLGAHENAARSVAAAGHRDEMIRAVVDGFARLSRHVVQPEVKLVEGEVLLRLRRGLAGVILVGVRIIQLDRREDGVVQSAVQRGDVERTACDLLAPEGRDRQICLGVPVQHVDQLMAAIMMARPLGSTHRNCPGTILRHPLFPKVSSVHLVEPIPLSYCSTTIRPLSLPHTR